MSDPIAITTAMHTLAEAVPDEENEAADMVFHGQHLYRVTVERVAPDEASSAMRQFVTEGEKPWKY